MRPKFFHLAVTDGEQQTVKFRASRAGLTVSGYIRRAIRKAKISNTDNKGVIKRQKLIPVRFTQSEKDNLSEISNTAGVSMAAYIRLALLCVKFGWEENDLSNIDEDLISLGISINTFTKLIHTGKYNEEEIFMILPSIISYCSNSISMLTSCFSSYSSTAATASDECHFELWISQFYGIRNNFNQIRNHIVDKYKNHGSLTDLDLILQNVNIIIDLITRECGK